MTKTEQDSFWESMVFEINRLLSENLSHKSEIITLSGLESSPNISFNHIDSCQDIDVEKYGGIDIRTHYTLLEDSSYNILFSIIGQRQDGDSACNS